MFSSHENESDRSEENPVSLKFPQSDDSGCRQDVSFQSLQPAGDCLAAKRHFLVKDGQTSSVAETGCAARHDMLACVDWC